MEEVVAGEMEVATAAMWIGLVMVGLGGVVGDGSSWYGRKERRNLAQCFFILTRGRASTSEYAMDEQNLQGGCPIKISLDGSISLDHINLP